MKAERWLEQIAARREAVTARLAETEARLADVRLARNEWTDEEHDPEGFALTFEWQHAEGARLGYLTELADLDAAEARVHAGTYGICGHCGQAIPDEQLELRPARTRCVTCTDRERLSL